MTNDDFDNALQDPNQLSEAARRYFVAREFNASLEAYRQLLNIVPNHLAALEGCGACAYQLKEFETAYRYYEQLTRLAPKEARFLVAAGAVLNELNRYQDAVAVLRKAVRRDIKSAEAYFNLGIAYHGLNDRNMSISCYREAIRLSPRMAVAHAKLAVILQDIRQHEQAQTHYQQALLIDPSLSIAQQGLKELEELQVGTSNGHGAFGRLVETSARQKSAMKWSWLRSLNRTERVQDRTRVTQLIGELDERSRECLAHLHEEFEPMLHTVNRALIDGGKSAMGIHDTVGKYHASLEKLAQLRQASHQAAIRLRAHEELMNTPEIPPLEEIKPA